MTKTFLMNSLVEKMQSPDQDFRFMGLNDLMNEIKQDPHSFQGDDAVETKVLKQVLALVEDKISEVKNQAVKCLGQLIKILRQTHMELVVDKLIVFSVGTDEELRDISALALKTITAELPADGKIAASACLKLAPKLIEQLQNSKTPPEALVETLSILSILIVRFPGNLTSLNFAAHPLTTLAPLLSHPRPIVRRRAITTISQYIPISPQSIVSDLMSTHVLPNLQSSAPLEKQKTTVQLVAALARNSPGHISPVLGQVVPGVLKSAQTEEEELQESSLLALEALVLRCPSEITPFLTSIIQVGNQLIKYDPNYAGDDDEDEEMADPDEDDDDEDLDEYSDDEDTSYKIRRAATKVLSAVIGSRPELLMSIFRDVSPVLISRFGDREETVRLEVWATYVSLLNQTAVYGAFATKEETLRGKRKRDVDLADSEESPFTLLNAQVPSLAKALLSQLKSPKTSPTTLQSGFTLLKSLLEVLPGSLTSQIPLITTTCKTVLSSPSSSSTSQLYTSCLSFLALFFATHPATSYSASLPTLSPSLVKALQEKHPRVASEAFRVFSALLNATKPVTDATWPDAVYTESLARLAHHDTDADVRATAEDVMADLWICATDTVKAKDRKEWEAICRSTGNTDGAVRVITKVAENVTVDDNWINGCNEWLLNLLKKSGRNGKAEIFVALSVLLNSYSGGLPPNLPEALIVQVKSYMSVIDISLLSQALKLSALLLKLSPATTFPVIEKTILSDVYKIAHSPLLAGAALDSLLNFIDALVLADTQIATHVVPNIVLGVEKAPKAEASPANAAKCVSQVVKSYQGVAAGVIAEYSRHVKPESKAKSSSVALSLLILGELGRFIDMSLQVDTFTHAIEHFSSDEEDVRAAASFAAGNIAIGNLHQFLPALVTMVQNDPKNRLLSLHALKEVVTHCETGQLESVADMLWVPLFEHSENSEETTRNVAAACLGKLATTRPSVYLPQLHARIKDSNAPTRATVVAAVRFTLTDTAQSYDEVLGPLLPDFLSVIVDQDLTVRRLALSALNSAARTKPHLLRDHLSAILPTLYKETEINTELIRTVQMGPWQHKVDDGLDARKTAYETMYTLVDTCLSKIALSEFLDRVIVGLADTSDEIKVICHMVLFRLSQLAPAAVMQKLDDATPHLEKTMKGANITKDTVKQDLERAAELQRSALRAVAALSKVGGGVSPKFDTLVEELKRNAAWSAEFKD